MCSQHIMHDIACTFHPFVSFWFIFSISMVFIIPSSSSKLWFCQLWCVLCLWTLELSLLLELSMKVSTLFSCPCINLVAASILLKKDFGRHSCDGTVTINVGFIISICLGISYFLNISYYLYFCRSNTL